MIKLSNVNKYYNYKKRNQIHVSNNISLTLPDKGLVCLLGPSGSGKTTLLNIIGGLDKLDSGLIEIDGKVINTEKQWNYYRTYKFGYIFQNYLLINDLNVYENLEFSLKPFNLTTKEVNERINYALKAVSMDKYKYRMPNELSGGQQQRIAIARALIKSPDVYIADEPTGNIDEKNTTIVMNILKKLSLSSLVVLVTHERRLADFYAERIIEIKDGMIVADYHNEENKVLSRFDDNNLYLQEYNQINEEVKDVEVSYFYNDKASQKLKLNVVFENNTYYIKANDDKVKVEYLDDKKEVKMVDAKVPEFDLQEALKTKFELDKLQISNNKLGSSLSLKDKIKIALNNVSRLKFIQKIMLFIFFVASILLTYGFAIYTDSNYVDERSFLTYHRDLVRVETNKITSINELDNLKTLLNKDYLLTSYNLTKLNSINVDEFYQRNQRVYVDIASIFPLDDINNETIVYGRMPSNHFEIVMDLYLANTLLKLNYIKNLGIKLAEQFIGLTYRDSFATYTIVGIIDNNNPCFYINTEGYKLLAVNNNLIRKNNLIVRYDDYSVSNYTLIDSSIEKTDKIKDLELTTTQILVSQKLFNDLEGRNLVIGQYEFEVVGTYAPDVSYEVSIYLQKEQLDYFYDVSSLLLEELFIISNNKEEDLSKLSKYSYTANDVYRTHYEARLILDKNYTGLFYASIFVVFSLIFLYFIMKSSIQSRTYTIGIYRSLGVSKLNILILFLIEIGLITILSSLIGVIIFSIVISRINAINYIIYYPVYVPLLTFLIIYILNSIIGILPVFPVLRKTPSQILSKFDF